MNKKMKNNIEKLFYELVKIKSDTGTSLEKDIEEFIYNELSQFSYFKENNHLFGKTSLKDEFEREVIWGLVKGESKNTIILLHHHDVVDSYDYGKYKNIAYNPKKLKKEFKKLKFSKEINNDLNNKNWCFGRGTCDMKAGSAIQIELLRYYSELDNFKDNILLLSVPDEETYSGGMRTSIKLLNQLKEKFNLSYNLLINSEPHERLRENEGTFYDGSVGKIMPLVYVKGKKSHIGQIFSGFNPLLLLSKIAINTEVNMDFSDELNNDISPPPSWSYLKDFKESYDASIPEAAGGYFSVLTLTQSPKDILEKLKDISKKAFKDSINLINKNHKIFKNESSEDINLKPSVRYFSDIYKEAYDLHGDKFKKVYLKTIDEINNEINNGETIIPNSNFKLIKKTLEYVENQDPVVIISLSPPYYPHVSNDFLDTNEKINSIKDIINDKAKEFNETYRLQKYFMGISDLSYTSLNNSEEVIPYIKNNMPLWNHLYSIDFNELNKLNIPVINLGPWGKDLHKLTERVYLPDLTNNTPKLIMDIINHMFN